ncbi:MAG: 23S rRNA (uracil(1939)-C(5))-methyltransferase RlmD [Acholeplasmataceae bacterium]|nr:23S rRNA (uracil(1939)-C(5))-methyltransferase RlmD [Acholeplasmataceae bacterium]
MILECIDLDFNGKGVCKKDGFVYFIENLLKGEVAEVKITETKKNFGFGEVIKYERKSPYRTHDFPLSYANLYHLDNQIQLDYQQELTKETFKKISHIEVNVEKIITDNKPFFYRNKITLQVKKVGNQLKLGSFENKSHQLEVLESHLLADEVINKGIQQLNSLFDKYVFMDESLKRITLRSNHKDLMIIFTTTTEKWNEKELILNEITAYSIYQNILDDQTENLGRVSILLKGNPTLPLELLGLQFRLYPTGFFQTNYAVTELLYKRVLEEIKPITYLDAYAGAAIIGQIISKKAKQVFSVDINQDSIQSANESIQLNKLHNVEAILGDVEEKMNQLEVEGIIFDPPRSGLSKKIIDTILSKSFEQIIYISCNLRTLARDLNLLLTKYQIKYIIPVKMFYQTTETETIVVLDIM